MRKAFLAALFASVLAMPALAMSEAECRDLWKQADADRDGALEDVEANRYLAAMRVHGLAFPDDGRITAATFMRHCRADVFRIATPEPGAPLKGSNGFSQIEAKAHAMAAGFTGLSELKKDDDGVWRGTAAKDGRPVSIAIDYKGNVVSDVAR